MKKDLFNLPDEDRKKMEYEEKARIEKDKAIEKVFEKINDKYKKDSDTI
ncbi:hypothetical protein ACLIBH_00675 [Virgibacillus sp. W0430]